MQGLGGRRARALRQPDAADRVACAPQGLGSPACARILTSWYPDRERGTFWGFWTASNNIGGFLAPIIAGNAAAHYGWRCGPLGPEVCLCFCVS